MFTTTYIIVQKNGLTWHDKLKYVFHHGKFQKNYRKDKYILHLFEIFYYRYLKK